MSQIQATEQEEIEQLKQSLPKAPFMGKNDIHLIKYQGFWCKENFLCTVLKYQRHFQARDCDLIITGLPKTGTTWLKSLLFATVNRNKNPINQSPLLTNHPQELVFALESDVYSEAFTYPRPQHLHELPSPRLLSTHLPYASLPESIKRSKCRLLYICRNPLDTLVSLYHFSTSVMKKAAVGEEFQAPNFEDCFKEFCDDGRYLFGPFFEHAVAYWKLSLEDPDKVLFLKYEDLKDDPVNQMKKLAKFVGMTFTSQEENEGLIEQIIELCSMGSMKELEVNKNGVINKFFEKKSYFRKGEVGEWRNYFTPAMFQRITKLMDEKLEGTGLSFKLIP